ncbi:MAG: helix-turn-helix domain-containing protein [Flavobacteriales bacterium]|nr:helix-turn-helix domain-containing protein [Flavobacteriales bacterium]
MITESQIQFISVTPKQLAELISESVKTQIQELLTATNKQQPTDEKELLTRKEAKELFKVSYPTIHSWMNNGIIKPKKVGNKTFFLKSELMQVVESSNRF